MTRNNIIIVGSVFLLLSSAICLFVIFYERSKDAEENRITPEEWVWLASHEGHIRVGTEPSSPPLSFEENGLSRGYIHDYLNLIEKKLNIKFQMVVPGSFAAMMDMGMKGELDVVAGIIETPGRARHFLFTRPVVEYPLVVIVESGAKKEIDVKSLSGLKVVATEGYSVVSHLRATYPKIDLHTVKNDYEAFKEVSFGYSDAVVTDLPTAKAMISAWGFGNLKVAGDIGYEYQIRIAISRDYPELKRIMDKAIFSLPVKAVASLEEKWQVGGDRRLFVGPLVINSAIGISCVLISLILGLFIWNRTLKIKIEEKTRALDDHNSFLKEQVELKRNELGKANSELSHLLSEMKTLKGLLPICLHCKMVRDDEGFWKNVDEYLSHHTKAQFSHGICPDCARMLYPELYGGK